MILYEGGRYGMTEWVTSFGSHVLLNQKGQVHQLEGQKQPISSDTVLTANVIVTAKQEKSYELRQIILSISQLKRKLFSDISA